MGAVVIHGCESGAHKIWSCFHRERVCDCGCFTVQPINHHELRHAEDLAGELFNVASGNIQ